VAEHVSEEVHGAALPGHAEHLADRGLEALMGVGDAQQHAAEAAGDEAAEEVAPEALRLRLADVEADHLAATGLVHAIGDHERFLADAAGLADTLDFRVESSACRWCRC
jgi:hypothetical protein